MAFTMLSYSFVIFYFALASKQSFAITFCSSDGFTTLLQCLLEEKRFMNWAQILDHGIECSKEGDCNRKPWQYGDPKVKLVKNYYECMKKVAVSLNNPEINGLIASEFSCRKEFADNLPVSYQVHYLQILPELDTSPPLP